VGPVSREIARTTRRARLPVEVKPAFATPVDRVFRTTPILWTFKSDLVRVGIATKDRSKRVVTAVDKFASELVNGDIPVARITALNPPRPAERASAAAHTRRARSFSVPFSEECFWWMPDSSITISLIDCRGEYYTLFMDEP